jgi:ClpX C4-type zinc finger protein
MGGSLRVATISVMPDEGFEGGPESGRAPIDGDTLRCSFCGRGYSEVASMICGPMPSVAICNECVELVTEVMREEPGGGPTRAV